MDQHHHFFRLLKEVKRKLWLQNAIDLSYHALLSGASMILLWILISRFIVIPFLSTKIMYTIGILLTGFVVFLFWKRPGDLAAVKKFDQQGLNDRVRTAYDFLKEKSAIVKLQREETLERMRQALPAIKKEKIKWFQWKKITIACCLLLLACLGIAFPNEVMETAKNEEEEIEIVEENKEKVEQFTEKHKEKATKEIEEKLDELLDEVKQSDKAEEISEDLLQAENQLNELRKQSEMNEKQLKQITEQLHSQGLEKLANAANQGSAEQIEEQMAEMLEQLNDFSEEELQDLQDKFQSVSTSSDSAAKPEDNEELSKEQLEELMSDLEEQLKDLAESAGKTSELTQAQSDLQQLAENMQQQLASAGLATPGSLSFADGSSTSGSTSGSGAQQEGSQQGGSDSGSKSGRKASSNSNSSSGNGGASSSGNGSGAGKTSGPGNGTGSGSGSGSGNGNGAGTGAGNHELSVPQQLEGQENQEVDKGELGSGSSEKEVAPNTPVLPGEVRSYEEVYEHYENTYRQAIERNDYPAHLQEIIKHYFSDIKPSEES